MLCPTFLVLVALQNTVHLNKQLECITICRNRNCNYEMMHKTMDDLRAMEADNIIEGSQRRLHHFGCHDL
jgi:hypothetical protein